MDIGRYHHSGNDAYNLGRYCSDEMFCDNDLMLLSEDCNML